jgi:hypothetical protein
MSYEAQAELSNVLLAFVIVRKYAKKCGAFAGYAAASIAAIVAKHSVHTFISVSKLRRGRLAWQQVPSVSTCHVSGRSSQISTNSFPTIFFTNFGGTEPKPAMICRSATGGGAAPNMGGAVTAAGHDIAAAGAPEGPPECVNGHDQVVLDVAPLPAEAIERGTSTTYDTRGAISRGNR